MPSVEPSPPYCPCSTWKTLVAAPKGVSPTHFETVGTGKDLLAFYSEAGQEKTLL